MLFSGNGRHRAASPRRTATQRLLAGAGIAGVVGLALPMAGATSATADAKSASSTAEAATTTTTAAATTTTATGDSYTVVSGDWLSSIAERKHVSGGWERLYQLNRSTLTQGPNVIFPGEHLRLGGTVAASATSNDSSSTAAPAAPAAPAPAATDTASAPAAAPTASSGLAAAIAFAQAQLGKAYVYGGTGPDDWDCSGLTQAALAQAGISIPRTAAEQAAASTPVSMNDLQAGDLLFWSSDGTDAGVYHVALYIGNGNFIEAANPSAGVKTDNISDYAPSFAGSIS
jgi:cell wall-associated NlpC family hydrolase